MTDNEILARWQGPMFGEPPDEYYELPDYLNDDAACDSLLDTLVDKGLEPTLQYHREMGWWIDVTKEIGVWADTRREAIVSACLEVAMKEAQGTNKEGAKRLSRRP